MKVTFTNAMKLATAAFDGVSERLLHLTATTALTYLAGVNGWNDEPKLPAETIREKLTAEFLTSGNKRTTAYVFAQTGWKLAARLSKGDKAFRETLKAADLTEAVALVVTSIKADLDAAGMPRTIDGLKTLLDGGKPKKDKPAKTAAARILEIINDDDTNLSDQEIEDILSALRGMLDARNGKSVPVKKVPAGKSGKPETKAA